MAKIQPEDIRSQSLKKGLFGYKSADVDSFKNSIYRAYDEVYRENGKLTEDLEKLNASLQECRVKIFELETQVENGGGGNASSDDVAKAKKEAEQIIANAKKEAADIVAKAKASDGDVKAESTATETPKSTFGLKSDEPKKTDSSRFFKKEEPTEAPKAAPAADEDDDDEIFVGEIEDARKPDRMMIGDGEEEDADFEFL